jgi:hypothetical protein
MQIGMIGLGRMGANMVRRSGTPSPGARHMKPRLPYLTERSISG